MSFTREHNAERLSRQIESCGQELDLCNRSFSLPDCSKSAPHIWDRQSTLCNRSLSVSTPSKSTRWALYRSFSYEQCYIKEGSDFRQSPIISMCKLEHSYVEYYSPEKWKEGVVKASKFNQDSLFLPENRSNNDEEIKNSGLSKSRNSLCIYSTKWLASLKKWMPTDRFKFLFFLVIPLIVLSVGIVTFCALAVASHRQFCKDSLNLEIIKSDLSQNIYGQDLALQSFLETIKEISSKNLNEPLDSLMSVVVFLGGTGVGKSYMVSLFTNLFPTHWTVQQFNAQVDLMDKESTDRVLVEVTKKLSHCGTNLIIMDDASDFMLSSSTTKGFPFVKKLHYAIQNERKKSIIILILNSSKEKYLNNMSLDIEQSINIFKQSLENFSNVQTYFIEFLPLSREHIVKCIKKAMEREEIDVPDHEIFKSLDMHSSKYFPNGCKGIYKYIHQISSKES